jgi:hypothetical protein
MSDPTNTMFVLLTHDAPLRERFVECATGIQRDVQWWTQGHKKEVYKPSPIYDDLNLTQRAPEQYPTEAAWVGTEFVEFAYKELLSALGKYIPHKKRHALKAEIKENGFGEGNHVRESMQAAIRSAEDVPVDLRMAMERLGQEIGALEMQIKQDITAHGHADTSGHYFARKEERKKHAEEARSYER